MDEIIIVYLNGYIFVKTDLVEYEIYTVPFLILLYYDDDFCHNHYNNDSYDS